MRRLQSTHPDLDRPWWWVDMLCINQASLPDRTTQVSLMRDIFQTATPTAAWLGHDSGTLMLHLTAGSTPSAKRAWVSATEGETAIKAFQDRPYWQRAWIIQEVCVSHNVLQVVCGHKTAPWKAMNAEHKWLRQRAFPEAHKVPDLRVLRPKFQRGELPLGFLVYRAKAAQCLNPRDQIFSLLGLVTGGSGAHLVPDHGLSPCEVFAAAIRAIDGDLGEACSKDIHRRGQMKRADSFQKKLFVTLQELREHSHGPLNEIESI